MLAAEGGTTHPEVVEGLIRYLQANGFQDLTIMEGSWVGDKTEESFEVCGYNELAEKYQVKLIDAQKEPAVTMDCGGLELHICRCATEVDYMINVPVMKGHCQTKITCALKNMKGMLPNSEKRDFMPWVFMILSVIWLLVFLRILFWWTVSVETCVLKMEVTHQRWIGYLRVWTRYYVFLCVSASGV